MIFFIPEVVQTSAMDCGPASLKSLLAGFGVDVSYGRLREACQTDVDGTSIDTLEEIANQLGLAAEQVMIPADHLLLNEAQSLPALAVIVLPNGLTHFVVVWRTVGRWVQLMDPAIGRRWVTRSQLLQQLYRHRFPVPAAGWREFAGSSDFLDPLMARMNQIGCSNTRVKADVTAATADLSWHSLAILDAAVRFVDSLIVAKALRRGSVSADFLVRLVRETESYFQEKRADDGAPLDEYCPIPSAYWSVEPLPTDEDEAQLLLKGAVLIKVNGVKDVSEPVDGEEVPPLPQDLVAALNEKTVRPEQQLWAFLRADGLLQPFWLILLIIISAGTLLIESLLLRGLLDAGHWLTQNNERLAFMAGLIVFFVLSTALSYDVTGRALQLGRQLEMRLRLAFREKIPRLHDHYFHSRPISDMAERGHSLHKLRQIPLLGARFLETTVSLLFLTIGLTILAPRLAWQTWMAAALAVFIPLLLQRRLSEQDLRVRTHSGALSTFYLDALRGLIPIRTHGAESNIQREHENLLVVWGQANFAFYKTVVRAETITALSGFLIAGALVGLFLAQGGTVASLLLLVYWLLRIPLIGQEIAFLARQYPAQRNHFLRLLEPLGTPEQEEIQSTIQVSQAAAGVKAGVRLEFENLFVQAAGHLILANLNCSIGSGEHVAIVGPSGAGKSSLVGLLLGWYRPVHGALKVDGEAITDLARLRQETAWVDPAVHLWNDSLIENVRYGGQPDRIYYEAIVTQAELLSVLEKLPDGWQTKLGENGGLVSGGEGQRVRLGRAMTRPEARLVILDEPFRGLDRPLRQKLLANARAYWPHATLLCITHDVTATADFERVLVIQDGQIVEDDRPQTLLENEETLYKQLYQTDHALHRQLWNATTWRRWRLEDGRLYQDEAVDSLGESVDKPEDDEILEPVDREPMTQDEEWWSSADLPKLLSLLAQAGGLPISDAILGAPLGHMNQLPFWLETAVPHLGLAAEPLHLYHRDIDNLLVSDAPFIIQVPGQDRVLAMVGAGRGRVRILTPDGRQIEKDRHELRVLLCAEREAPFRAGTEAAVSKLEISSRKRSDIVDKLLADRLAFAPITRAWHLRLPAEASLRQQNQVFRFGQQLGLFLLSYTGQQLLWILSWWFLGRLIFQPSTQVGLAMGGWLIAWFWALVSSVPLRAWSMWLQGQIAITGGGVLKKRLLVGVLRLRPDEVKTAGTGQFMGRVFESDALETLALKGGFYLLMGGVELALTIWIMMRGGQAALLVAALICWLGLTFGIGWYYLERRRRWSQKRLHLTHDLIERMVGHRTRLAQARKIDWHLGEDNLLVSYLKRSQQTDRMAQWLQGGIPAGWLALGVMIMAPLFVFEADGGAILAITLGGILSGGLALAKFVEGLLQLSDAIIAAEHIKDLFNAASRARLLGDPKSAATLESEEAESDTRNGMMLAKNLTFRYRAQDAAIFENVDFSIDPRDRILLSSRSGGGKSTLASLIVGLRDTQSGLLLLHGLDRSTWGQVAWRRLVASAPQFHENHVMLGTFAFNLLMGRQWPPQPDDLMKAEAVCEALGLRPLLDKMPAGMMQMVGETGWRLSHGEQSRLFLARAILQEPELMILDESFGALDPQTLQLAMKAVLDLDAAVIVIAHP